jgi:hypothetical protein
MLPAVPVMVMVIALPLEAGTVLLVGPHWNVLRLIVVSRLLVYNYWSWMIIYWLMIVISR